MDKNLEEEVRTPVRERVRNLNKRSQASPEKFLLMKQQLMEIYFKRKSPKASQARERIDRQPEEETKTIQFKGTNNSPLLGVSGKPEPTTTPSKGSGLESEEYGRTWGKDVEKKALKALARWPLDPGPSFGSPMRWKPKKRLQRPAPGKIQKEGTGVGDSNVLQRWLQREKEGSKAPKTCLGPGKSKGTRTKGEGEL